MYYFEYISTANPTAHSSPPNTDGWDGDDDENDSIITNSKRKKVKFNEPPFLTLPGHFSESNLIKMLLYMTIRIKTNRSCLRIILKLLKCYFIIDSELCHA